MRLVVRRSWAAAAAAVLALQGLGACSDTAQPVNSTVNVADNVFQPASVTVATGTTVTWQWTGSNQHNVTWVSPSGTSNSPTQASGTFTRNFSAAGTHDYYCTIHGTPTAGMRGSVIVN